MGIAHLQSFQEERANIINSAENIAASIDEWNDCLL